MLTIVIPDRRLFNSDDNTFFFQKGATLTLEHSLISVSKWEAKWKKPFLDRKNAKTYEESVDYIRCMTITQNVDPGVYMNLTNDIIDQVSDYIGDSMTATWFSEEQKSKAGPPSREIITSEIIYYWMIANNIPHEYERWHLNRLLTLIQVCSIKNAPPKKMTAAERNKYNSKLNAARRAKHHTRG